MESGITSLVVDQYRYPLQGTSMTTACGDDATTIIDIPQEDDDSINNSSSTSTQEATIQIPLGSRTELKELFSYPNNPSHYYKSIAVATNNGYDGSSHNSDESVDVDEGRQEDTNDEMMLSSLEKTIEHYLTYSILRDGYFESKLRIIVAKSKSKSKSKAPQNDDINDDRLYVSISGNAAIPYSFALPKFLKIGKLGLQACQQVKADGGLWKENWKFFLPLGLPMTRHKTVQLMHFPPIYTLEEDEDYLASRSTKRWKQLLVINSESENHERTKTALDQDEYEQPPVADDTVDRYQAIIDIVPIAAPSSDGKNMKDDDVYPYFDNYIRESLKFWTCTCNAGGGGTTKPIIAFGWPVKCWVEKAINQTHERHNRDNIMDQTNNGKEEENGRRSGNDPDNESLLQVLSLTRIPIIIDADDDNSHHYAASSSTSTTTAVPVLIANHPSYLYNVGKRIMTSNNTVIESLEREEEDSYSLLVKIMIEDLIAVRWQVKMGLSLDNPTNQKEDPYEVLQECCRFWRKDDDPSKLEEIHELISSQAFILH